jgi:hypothetical protein
MGVHAGVVLGAAIVACARAGSAFADEGLRAGATCVSGTGRTICSSGPGASGTPLAV